MNKDRPWDDGSCTHEWVERTGKSGNVYRDCSKCKDTELLFHGTNKVDPADLVGYEVPAADGGDYGHRVIGYQSLANDYIVEPIKWSNGAVIGELTTIDCYKLGYRYQPDAARKTQE